MSGPETDIYIKKIFSCCKKKLKLFVFAAVVFLSVQGCTYIGPGIYHKVSEGETVWSISRAYGIKSAELVRANTRHLPDPDRIQSGQHIYVPGARRPITARTVTVQDIGFIWPVRGEIIHKFGREGTRRYLGLTIGAPEGTPVLASEAGRVIFVSENFRAYGNTIIIEHENDYVTVYAHNGNMTVQEEQKVEKSEKIAEVGSTGNAETPRLYFEIRYKETPENPLHLLP